MRNEPSKGLPYYMALTEIREAPEVFLGIGFNDLVRTHSWNQFEQALIAVRIERAIGAPTSSC